MYTGVFCRSAEIPLSLTPPEPDAALRLAEAVAVYSREPAGKRTEAPCYSADKKGCWGGLEGKGNSIDVLKLFSAGGLHRISICRRIKLYIKSRSNSY